jgi:hypothetical protein
MFPSERVIVSHPTDTSSLLTAKLQYTALSLQIEKHRILALHLFLKQLETLLIQFNKSMLGDKIRSSNILYSNLRSTAYSKSIEYPIQSRCL